MLFDLLIYRYDVSGDGQIDQKELSNLISAMYDLVGETDRKGDREPKKRAAEIIAKLDVGGDKKLNKQEFIAGYVIHLNLTLIFLLLFSQLDAKMIQLFVVCLHPTFKIVVELFFNQKL
jgi:hypothetical protein